MWLNYCMPRSGLDICGFNFWKPNPPRLTHLNLFSLIFAPDTRVYPPVRPTVGSDLTGHGRIVIFCSPLVATIADYNVFRILVDQGSSYDIMYNKLFSKLQATEDYWQPLMVQPLGCVKLPNTFDKEGDHTFTRTIQV
jgi:hypothetical protein